MVCTLFLLNAFSPASDRPFLTLSVLFLPKIQIRLVIVQRELQCFLYMDLMRSFQGWLKTKASLDAARLHLHWVYRPPLC